MLEQILAQVQYLSPEDRIRLIQQIAESLLPAAQPPRPSGPGLVYGAFHGARMSTEEDFGLTPSPTTGREGNGS